MDHPRCLADSAIQGPFACCCDSAAPEDPQESDPSTIAIQSCAQQPTQEDGAAPISMDLDADAALQAALTNQSQTGAPKAYIIDELLRTSRAKSENHGLATGQR